MLKTKIATRIIDSKELSYKNMRLLGEASSLQIPVKMLFIRVRSNRTGAVKTFWWTHDIMSAGELIYSVYKNNETGCTLEIMND